MEEPPKARQHFCFLGKEAVGLQPGRGVNDPELRGASWPQDARVLPRVGLGASDGASAFPTTPRVWAHPGGMSHSGPPGTSPAVSAALLTQCPSSCEGHPLPECTPPPDPNPQSMISSLQKHRHGIP